ncbi:serine-rich adhesin for platelets-like isoform X2 [Neodiprion pinetum]|uniref:serine-rich adhesin for platelets-like isoform X2 n=1 Tax=Neodiprion pinetum TaxID=441929 RepID=UPI001EDE8073|nr:uncharacterized protein LOC124222618 isoform X2 [Neodiprion pinetum]
MAMSSLTGLQSGLVDQPELIFELEWKRPPKYSARRQDPKARIGICDPPDPSLDLWLFKSYLCQNIGLSGDIAISYVDSDGDELPIDSECEFREALKFARSQSKKYKNVVLIIDKIGKQELSSNKVDPKQALLFNACDGLFVIPKKPSLTTKNEMAPIHMTGIIRSDEKVEENPKTNSSFASSSPENAPPAWFRSYMDSMKREIVEEVSTKVMSEVMGVLNAGSSETCSSCSHSMHRNRHSQESNTEEKLRRKKKKRAIGEVESSDTFNPPQQPDVQVLRRLKKIESLAHNFHKALENKRKKCEKIKYAYPNIVLLDNNLDKRPKSAFVPVISAAPKDELPTKCETDSNSASCSEGRARMNCSVTGQEMLEKPTSKGNTYESESDSDNISMLYDSDNSVNLSDAEHDYNFEMVQTPPCFILDKPLNTCDSQDSKPPETFDNSAPLTADRHNFNVVCEAESDRNNNQDSPSYEVLSDPASSDSSLRLNEDHFHVSRNISEQTSNADLIDLNHENQDEKKSNVLVIDMAGKVFEESIDDASNEVIEIYLNKRPGGSYAFVNETLPSHVTKDTSQMSKSDTNLGESNYESCNLNLNMKSSHPSYESKKDKSAPTVTESQTTFQSQTEFKSGMTNDTTHSFSSHSSHTTGSGVYTFTQVQTQTSHTDPKYTVIDNNASKGLEETKYTSCENDLGVRDCQSKLGEDKQTNDTGGKYRREFTSEGSACVFTEQPQKSSVENETRESSPDIGRASNDAVHILPETLVSGAVTVASSAYSTARRVFDRIRSMQTGGAHENVEDGVLGSDIERYFSVLEEMGFTNVELNARLLHEYKFDMSRVISALVQ